MANQRRAGLIQVKANGTVYAAKGAFTVGYGIVKREAIIGSDGVHGYKETPTAPYVEGAITDRGNLDLVALFNGTDQTVSVDFGNGKLFLLREGWYAGDGTLNSEEGEIPVRWEGMSAEEVA
jgi:hypothetical protein